MADIYPTSEIGRIVSMMSRSMEIAIVCAAHRYHYGWLQMLELSVKSGLK